MKTSAAKKQVAATSARGTFPTYVSPWLNLGHNDFFARASRGSKKVTWKWMAVGHNHRRPNEVKCKCMVALRMLHRWVNPLTSGCSSEKPTAGSIVKPPGRTSLSTNTSLHHQPCELPAISAQIFRIRVTLFDTWGVSNSVGGPDALCVYQHRYPNQSISNYGSSGAGSVFSNISFILFSPWCTGRLKLQITPTPL